MKIIIGGAGAVGTHLAELLSRENQDIVIIDDDNDRLDPIRSGLASVALERQQARQEKQATRSQKSDGSFSTMNEFVDLL